MQSTSSINMLNTSYGEGCRGEIRKSRLLAIRFNPNVDETQRIAHGIFEIKVMISVAITAIACCH